MNGRALAVWMIVLAIAFQILQGQGLFRYYNFRKNEAFGASPGVFDQLDSTRVVTVGEAREARRDQMRQVQHDLRDLTEGGISIGM